MLSSTFMGYEDMRVSRVAIVPRVSQARKFQGFQQLWHVFSFEFDVGYFLKVPTVWRVTR